MTHFELRPWLEIGGTAGISVVAAVVAITQDHLALVTAILGVMTPLLLVTAWLVRTEMTTRQTKRELDTLKAELARRLDRQEATMQQLIAHLPRRRNDRD